MVPKPIPAVHLSPFLCSERLNNLQTVHFQVHWNHINQIFVTKIPWSNVSKGYLRSMKQAFPVKSGSVLNLIYSVTWLRASMQDTFGLNHIEQKVIVSFYRKISSFFFSENFIPCSSTNW